MTAMMDTPSGSLAWYLRTAGDQDTHRGTLAPNGTVLAVCGAQFQEQDDDNQARGYFIGECGHPVPISHAGHLGECPCDKPDGNTVWGLPGGGPPITERGPVNGD